MLRVEDEVQKIEKVTGVEEVSEPDNTLLLTRCTFGDKLWFMNTIRVSATHARNNFFQLLDRVSIGGLVKIEKDSKTVAMMVPVKQKNKHKGLIKALERAAKGFVYKQSDNPLRRKGAADFLGKWDK